jgi:hypothetical protein
VRRLPVPLWAALTLLWLAAVLEIAGRADVRAGIAGLCAAGVAGAFAAAGALLTLAFVPPFALYAACWRVGRSGPRPGTAAAGSFGGRARRDGAAPGRRLPPAAVCPIGAHAGRRWRTT